ncbi:MAG TPA: hypothetical protein VF883_22945, partial [Thermoanaerobaculia bacterium]
MIVAVATSLMVTVLVDSALEQPFIDAFTARTTVPDAAAENLTESAVAEEVRTPPLTTLHVWVAFDAATEAWLPIEE